MAAVESDSSSSSSLSSESSISSISNSLSSESSISSESTPSSVSTISSDSSDSHDLASVSSWSEAEIYKDLATKIPDQVKDEIVSPETEEFPDLIDERPDHPRGLYEEMRPRGDYGGKPAESPSERITLPADFSLEPRYDHEDPDVFHRMDFTPAQLDEIRRINNEEYINDNELEYEPILTLTSSISYAENALERRLKQQLEELHSV